MLLRSYVPAAALAAALAVATVVAVLVALRLLIEATSLIPASEVESVEIAPLIAPKAEMFDLSVVISVLRLVIGA
jgi:hypothetical protein